MQISHWLESSLPTILPCFFTIVSTMLLAWLGNRHQNSLEKFKIEYSGLRDRQLDAFADVYAAFSDLLEATRSFLGTEMNVYELKEEYTNARNIFNRKAVMFPAKFGKPINEFFVTFANLVQDLMTRGNLSYDGFLDEQTDSPHEKFNELKKSLNGICCSIQKYLEPAIQKLEY